MEKLHNERRFLEQEKITLQVLYKDGTDEQFEGVKYINITNLEDWLFIQTFHKGLASLKIENIESLAFTSPYYGEDYS